MSSQPWRTPKVRKTRIEAQEFINVLRRELTQVGLVEDETFFFGGSWRREAPSVGDIDVAIVTPDGTFGDLALPGGVDYQRRGPKIAQGGLDLDVFGAMHVDFWACSPQEIGAFLWFVTGPVELNVAMRQSAIKRNMSLSQVGLLDAETKEQLDDGTEADIARILGWRNISPRERQAWAKPKPGDEDLLKSNQRKVKSSDGKSEYTLTIQDDGSVMCTCRGFQFRQYCKHSKALLAELAQA